MSDKQVVTCIACIGYFDHHIVGAGHASDERCNTTSHRRHERPRLRAVLDTPIATAPYARRCSKLIDYRQVDRQIDRRAKIIASSQAIRRITQCEHNAQQERNSAALKVSQVRLRAAVNATATPLWCESAKHDFQSRRAHHQFLTMSNFRRNTTPTQCAPARAIF